MVDTNELRRMASNCIDDPEYSTNSFFEEVLDAADEIDQLREQVAGMNNTPLQQNAHRLLSIVTDVISECADTFVDTDEMAPEWVAIYKEAKEVVAAIEGGSTPCK